MRRSAAILTSLFLLSALCAARVEKIGPAPTGQFPDSIAKLLEKSGYRVALPDGTVVCELWFRTAIPATTGHDVEGANYPELSSSEFVGAMIVPKQIGDFRGQTIAPGAYGLRYELLPNDGNHMGVAQNRDFLLLTPAVEDKDPTGQLSFEQMVALSAKAAGTAHPAALSMVQPDGDTYPAIYKNDDGFYVFVAKLKTGTGELPVGLVVKGQSQ